ncbi:hypothetical protein [Kribbella pratensis]|uniref:hypothetical protein n=1 Tax=Kribbella pratensis TaxID=2512112 RepID=UPI00141701C4|nr:hypothetical protein [Kribbella pratensis]
MADEREAVRAVRGQRECGQSEALRRDCDQHGTALSYRPPVLPHFGGIVEPVIGTMMRLVPDELPGTAFSNVVSAARTTPMAVRS